MHCFLFRVVIFTHLWCKISQEGFFFPNNKKFKNIAHALWADSIRSSRILISHSFSSFLLAFVVALGRFWTGRMLDNICLLFVCLRVCFLLILFVISLLSPLPNFYFLLKGETAPFFFFRRLKTKSQGGRRSLLDYASAKFCLFTYSRQKKIYIYILWFIFWTVHAQLFAIVEPLELPI